MEIETVSLECDDDFIDPTPREILLRRAMIHRSRGELDMAGWLEQAAAEPDEAADDDDPFEMTLRDFGFYEAFCELMLRQGVWYVGQLVEWRAGMLLRLPNMDRRKLRRVARRLRRFGLHLRRGRRATEKWQIEHDRQGSAPDEQTEGDGLSSFTTRKIIELWEKGVSQREISSRFDLGRNTHYKVWTIIQTQQRRRSADALRRHLGEPEWLLEVATEYLPDSTQWELVVSIDGGARDRLRGLDTWESRPVRVEERK
ncbi:MAG TPA: hypothetical protein VND64_33755 [Pirellulales bacterium]|nr:hypothetical protein [Pirellulales bacterium]